MTHEQIIIRLTEKVLDLEEGIREQGKSIDDWIRRYKEMVAGQEIADKAASEMKQCISQQNREIMELKEANQKLIEGQKRDLAAMESFGIYKSEIGIGYYQDKEFEIGKS